uniref:Uncharacterized protein n=2 Tax=Picea TaxID=3328 RepID=A0A117NHR9_PICGL|nr:hypothetical protein ABT39_MTgene4152 [Picea glauca]QHR90340.1 hypothetical protein Q903MT_gene4363 [Picea sitchensis]
MVGTYLNSLTYPLSFPSLTCLNSPPGYSTWPDPGFYLCLLLPLVPPMLLPGFYQLACLLACLADYKNPLLLPPNAVNASTLLGLLVRLAE